MHKLYKKKCIAFLIFDIQISACQKQKILFHYIFKKHSMFVFDFRNLAKQVAIDNYVFFNWTVGLRVPRQHYNRTVYGPDLNICISMRSASLMSWMRRGTLSISPKADWR